MAALELLQKYTYKDYKKWEGRWELIEGIAYAMSPAPYPKHQKVVAYTWRELSENLECKECEAFLSPIDWVIDNENVVQPDVAIFCEDYEDKRYFTKTPPLIVEVLSLSTALKDVTTKFNLYEKNGVKYYVLINPETEEIEIFELIDDKYQLKKRFKSKGVCEFEWDKCKTKIDFEKVFK